MRVVTVPAEHFVARIGVLPDGWRAVVWDPEVGDLPDDLRAQVEVVTWPDVIRPDANHRLAGLPALRLVQLQSAGYDHIRDAVPPGVALANGRGVHTDETAEWAVALTLMLLRGMPGYLEQQRAGRWQIVRRPTYGAGSSALVIGAGSIGSRIATLLRAFKVDVTCAARTARTLPDGTPVVALDAIGPLLPRVDAVICIVPLSDATRGLVDASFLAAMKDGAVLVNAARGPVVVAGALVEECASGRLSAALDVTDPEPLPPDSPLWHTPNLLITPHVAGEETQYSYAVVGELIAAQVAAVDAGGPLRNVVLEG